MASTKERIKSAIARLKDKYLKWDKDDGAEGAGLSMADERALGRIMEAYEVGRTLGRSERFEKPRTVSVMKPGYFRLEESFWKQRLIAEVPSVGKHEVHYVNAAGYWQVMAEVAEKVALDEESGEEEMCRCLAFAAVFGMVANRVLTMRMDFYHLAVSSGAAFAAQMAKAVESPGMEVESKEYAGATSEYQKAIAHQVVKLAAKGEAARVVKASNEGGSKGAAESQ